MNNVLTRLASLSVIVLASTFCLHAQPVKEGKVDVSSFNSDKDDAVYLSGYWEFYWNKLLEPSDFSEYQPSTFVFVPGSWHKQKNFSRLGYATYRLRIVLPEGHKGLSIHFPVVNSSAKVWLNGELIQEIGKVSSDPEVFEPRLTSILIPIPEKIREAELIVQAANFNYFSGGLAATPQVGRTTSIFSHLSRIHGIEIFFAGSLIAMFIYQLILYFLYDRGKPYLWLALICLGVALRALIVHGGSFLLPNLFPSVSWDIWKKIEFGSVYAMGALFPLYVYYLFKGHAPKWPLYFFVSVCGLMCAAVLLTPQYVYGMLLEICHFALVFSFVYAFYSISRAWRAGNKDARIILLGVLASFPFILAEILKNSRLYPIRIEFMYLVEMGVLIFLVFQVYLLANHYANSYRNLESMNQNLEKIVEERSGQLITANEVKDRLLSVMSHDIKSPLNALRGILQVYHQGAISQEEFTKFTQHIETDLSKTSILVENILYWTASQLKGVQVKLEEFSLFQLIEENLLLFRTISMSKKISLTHNTSESLFIRTDRNILNLVIRNLISNAIKFSHEGGAITIDVRETSKLLTIEVKDQGIGMDDETLDTLLAPQKIVSATGTKNEKGTGLGLSLCREYLQKVGGELKAESHKGMGSTFIITLPR